MFNLIFKLVSILVNSQYIQPNNTLEKYRNSEHIVHKDGEEKLRNSIEKPYNKDNKDNKELKQPFVRKYSNNNNLKQKELEQVENKVKNFADKKENQKDINNTSKCYEKRDKSIDKPKEKISDKNNDKYNDKKKNIMNINTINNINLTNQNLKTNPINIYNQDSCSNKKKGRILINYSANNVIYIK